MLATLAITLAIWTIASHAHPVMVHDRPRDELEPKRPDFNFVLPEGGGYQLLEPRVPYQPRYNPIGIQQPQYGGIQPPQILLYSGGYPDFAFGPQGTNFLIPQPQPDPNIRNVQRPIFVAGYPKPAHIPPIEKDAEEVPTNPAKIPPFAPKGTSPEKLETFNEDLDPKSEAGDLENNPPQRANTPPLDVFNIRPDQRFFTLNGHSLYNFYPQTNQVYPGVQQPQYVLYDPSPAQGPQPKFVELVQNTYKPNIPSEPVKNVPQSRENDELNDSVIIVGDEEKQADSDVVNAADSEKLDEPTISQAQPGAIALAGPGGVAAAAPRGTAFVGRGGLAVSSPQATAIAGPAKGQINEEDEEEKEEENRKKEQEKNKKKRKQ